jgi:hypothetical protein
MIQDENEKPHRLEDIQKKLYSPNPNALPKRRLGVLHQVNHAVTTAWNSEPVTKATDSVKTFSMQSSFFKKFFIGTLVFFAIAVLLGVFLFFSGNSVSSDNVAINVLGNAYTPGGEVLPLTVEIANSNAVSLELADLIVQYGRNKPDVTDPSDITTARIPIGTIDPGKAVNQKVDLTLYGTEGTNKQVKFTLEYHVANSNAIYQKERIFSVIINTAPVALTIDAATSVTSGQPYSMTVKVTSNVKKVIPNMMLKVDYPIGFAFSNGEPGPTYLNNVWKLGDLNPGETREIKIAGAINAEDGEERSVRFYAGSQSETDKNAIGTTFTSVLHSVDIVKPFLQAKLVINGKQAPEVSVQPRSEINGVVNWSNNLPVRILNAKIVVRLNGALIDKTSVQAMGGFYNSADNTITWDRNTLAELAAVDPGANGSLGFTFTTLSLYQNGGVAVDPKVSLDVSISGQQPQEGTSSQEVNNIEHTTIKLGTDFQVTGAASYTGEPFINNGPLPPVANQKTTYTIKWTLTSSANNVNNVKVTATMPSYVHFLNTIYPTNSDLKIDPINGNLVWNAGTVTKGSGFTSQPKTVFFQVELAPSITQVNSIPTLINNIMATGTDAYTNTSVVSSWKEITTRLFNDPVFQPGDEIISQ